MYSNVRVLVSASSHVSKQNNLESVFGTLIIYCKYFVKIVYILHYNYRINAQNCHYSTLNVFLT